MAQPKKLGELAVVALKARELPNREIVGKQDPFCVFRLGEEAKRTKTDYRGGQHPIWDDQVNLTVYEGKTKMYVQLYDEDAKREDLISEGTVDLATVIKDGEQDDWFQLTYKNRKAGEIYLEITFYSAKPPPRRQPTRMNKNNYQRFNKPQGGVGAPPVPPVPTPVPGQTRPVSSHGYPPATGRPLPPGPGPAPSSSTPNRLPNIGPQPYIAPPPATSHAQQHHATPHMPAVIAPQPSTSSGYPPQQGYPPHAAFPPQPSSSTPPGSQPMLSQPFRPGHSPQNSYGGGNQGYPPAPGPGYPPQGGHNGYPPQQGGNNGYPPQQPGFRPPAPGGQQGYPPSSRPSGYPPSNVPPQQPFAPSSGGFNNFSTPVMAGSYPPSNGGGSNVSFPHPGQQQHHPGGPPAGFHAPPPSSSAYPPQPSHQGYPPAPSQGYPPHQPQQGYPPPASQGYPYPTR